MGLLSFDFYHHVLAPHVSRESHISILPDISGFESPCCSALALVLVEALRAVFHCAVELLMPTSVANDFAFFTHARIFISSTSTYGFFAAMASHGKVYMPTSGALFLWGSLCVDDRIQWVSSPISYDGCSRSIFPWFFNSSFPDLQEHLRRTIDGPWFR
eukprot:EG_transcript_9921